MNVLHADRANSGKTRAAVPAVPAVLEDSGMKALILDAEATVIQTSDPAVIAAAHAAGKNFWVELDERNAETERLLREILKIHPLAIEDVWNDIGIPKVEDFGDYVQLVVHGVREEDVEGKDIPLELSELDVVIGRNFLVTHAGDEKVCAIEPMMLEIGRNCRLLRKGPAWVAHAILDRLVDEYLPVVDRFDNQIEEMESKVLEGHALGEHATMRQILRIKRSLQMLRRMMISQREILHRLARAEFDEIPREAMPFYRDVFDHFVRVTEMVDGYRELASGVLEAHFSMQSHQMNEIMKRLTLTSTIMLPLSLIAGIYGMNFKKVFPELDLEYGYFYALGLMATIAISIILYFKRKRWL